MRFEGDDPKFSDRRPADKLLMRYSSKPANELFGIAAISQRLKKLEE